MKDEKSAEYQKSTAQYQFNKISQEYDAKRRLFIPCFDDFYKTTTDFVAKNIIASCSIPFPRRVLDIGAGTGLLTAFWQPYFPNAEFMLVDIAEKMLSVARARFAKTPNVHFAVADYRTDSSIFAPAPDAVISALSIHHLTDNEKQAFFARVHSALPDGGVFVNYDQFCADDPALNEWYTHTWEGYLFSGALTQDDITRWRERQKLDHECSVMQEVAALQEAHFAAVQCVYSSQKFAVIVATKGSTTC